MPNSTSRGIVTHWRLRSVTGYARRQRVALGMLVFVDVPKVGDLRAICVRCTKIERPISQILAAKSSLSLQL